MPFQRASANVGRTIAADADDLSMFVDRPNPVILASLRPSRASWSVTVIVSVIAHRSPCAETDSSE